MPLDHLKKKLTYTKINKKGELVKMTIEQATKKKKAWSEIPTAYYNLGMYLAIPLLLAIFLGKYLDEHFHTGSFFTLTLILFGTISTFYNLVRLFKDDGTTHKH